MGIDARIVVYAPNSKTAETACEAAFRRVAELEAIMSDYRPDSELMRLCAKAGGPPVHVSPDLFRILQRSQLIAKQTDGAFDVTVGPLIQLWRKARRETKLPDPMTIANAKRAVGWQKMTLDPIGHRVRLSVPAMRLDLGGIGKGYASDEALKALKKNGVTIALIEMGGDIVLGSAPPNTAGWKIEVPNAEGNATLAKANPTPTINLKNCAISSSGDTEQFVEIGGVRYSHVVDPKTGRGITKRAQATVIAPNGFTSDPLSTALTIIDKSMQAKLLSLHPKVKAYVKRLP
jgi:thiamine biosynthesis lipoprotein